MPDLEQNGLIILVRGCGANYWSSTENDANNAWKQNDGNQNNDNKNNTYKVRAVRDFKQKI